MGSINLSFISSQLRQALSFENFERKISNFSNPNKNHKLPKSLSTNQKEIMFLPSEQNANTRFDETSKIHKQPNILRSNFQQIKYQIQQQDAQNEQAMDAMIAQKCNNLRKMTLNYEEQLSRLKEETKKLSNPTLFKEQKIKIQNAFIQKISTFEVPEFFNKKRRKFLIGPISVGKSSILRKFLKANVKVGTGETTLSVSKVFQNQSVQVYDSPGINEQYDITKYQNIAVLFGMDDFLVCYNNSIKNVLLIVRILGAISKKNNQRIFLIRTQCDKSQDDDMKTLEQQLEIDRDYVQALKDIGFIPKVYRVFATSAKQDLTFGDNKKLINLLTKGVNNLQNNNEFLAVEN